MNIPAVLHVDPTEAGRARFAAIHLRLAPPSSLTQFSSLQSARLALDAGASFSLGIIAALPEQTSEPIAFVRWMRREPSLAPPIFLITPTLIPCEVAEAVDAGVDGVIPADGDNAAFDAAMEELFELHLLE